VPNGKDLTKAQPQIWKFTEVLGAGCSKALSIARGRPGLSLTPAEVGTRYARVPRLPTPALTSPGLGATVRTLAPDMGDTEHRGRKTQRLIHKICGRPVDNPVGGLSLTSNFAH